MSTHPSESDPREAEIALIQLQQQGLFTKVHVNVSQELIQVTEDKLTLILDRHSSSLVKRDAWIPPLTLFIPILTTLMTAKFETNIFPSTTWHAIFVVAAVLSAGWLLWTICSRPKKLTVIQLVNEIKGINS